MRLSARCLSRALRGPLVAVLVLFCGCAAPPTAKVRIAPAGSPLPAAGSQAGAAYRVMPGDTLWSISRRVGVPAHELMRANGISDARQLEAGRILAVPTVAASTIRIPLYANPRWTHIVIHHSATREGNARTIGNSQRRQRGFTNGLGYHFMIDNGTSGRRDGQIEVGPRWARQQTGAHCNANGMNEHGIGICLVGDFTNRSPSPAQMQALSELVRRLSSYYRIPSSRIIRHRDVPGKDTECPGDRFPWGQFKNGLF